MSVIFHSTNDEIAAIAKAVASDACSLNLAGDYKGAGVQYRRAARLYASINQSFRVEYCCKLAADCDRTIDSTAEPIAA